jgi:protein-disulfide isomerase
MSRLLFPATLAAAAGLAFASAAAPAPKAAVQRDWTRTVVMTPQGGFRMGNPAARVKLVEYGSLTCPHCAHFATTGAPDLAARYVRTGKVSYEYRNYVLNGLDVSASLIARCAGPGGFFRAADSFYARQTEWVDRVEAAGEDEWARVQALPPAQQAARFAELGGLARYAEIGGVTPQRARLCLADKAGLDRLMQMAAAAEARGVHSTPTFFINNVMAPVKTWPAIEPLIRKAGG